VLPTLGSKEAIFHLAQVVGGDLVAVTAPAYPVAERGAAFAGKQVIEPREMVLKLRAAQRAREDPEFTATMRGVAGCANVVHLRGATRGLTIEHENCHPFVRPGAAFAQNGAIHPQHLLPELLPAHLEAEVAGSTDSERLFLYLYDLLEDGEPFVEVVRDALAELLERFTSPVLNSMYLTPDSLHVINAHNPTAVPYPGDPHDLFALRFRVEHDLVVVASTGFDQPESRGWHTLDNMTILTVALDTLDVRIDALDGVPVPSYDYSESV